VSTSDRIEAEIEVPLERRPRHIAIIMDGNGRWAQRQNLPRTEGHLRGVESVRRVMEACQQAGTQVLTLYCLSSENWRRPASELGFLMALLNTYLVGERDKLVENNLRLRIIGQREGIPAETLNEMDQSVAACSQCTGMTLCLAINYGSRCEIVQAVRRIGSKLLSGEIVLDDITEQMLSDHLDTAGLPDPDLLIRTSGEMRISNYLLWQISYSEIWVTRTLWPEFDRQHLFAAIRDYANRDRRFGGLNPEGVPIC
jgi:undecaprenyl diphosphate synthase